VAEYDIGADEIENSGNNEPLNLLFANFNDKTVNAPIGTGGPLVGEPVSVSTKVTAIIKNNCMGSHCLAIADNDDYSAGTARFEFINGVEIKSGTLIIEADLWFHSYNRYNIYVRENGTASKSFISIHFASSGAIGCSDGNSSYIGNIAHYDINRKIHIKLIFDMDMGIYDIWFDGSLILSDESHGITDRGIGSVLFGLGHDADYDGEISVDNITVTMD
ncbi:hypothetical protein K8R61_03310, partial [bacterium]|nr:hypothetical protein [bacterium]